MFQFRSIAGSITGAWPMVLTQGICSILFGLLVIAVPEILIYLIGGLFVLGGGLLVALALRMRRRHRSASDAFREFRRVFFDDRPFDRRPFDDRPYSSY